MIEIINNQKKVDIPLKGLNVFTSTIIEALPKSKGRSVTVSFVADSKMRKLNKVFRCKDSTTDVLSFPFEAEKFENNHLFLGDVIISAEQAQKQAGENEINIELEFKQLILHGILHLLGYDHEIDRGEMNNLELKLRNGFGIT